ncbi:MAG: hypothetical protein QF596_09990 [Acidimicrobiales bacterium]|jgi:5'-methylthioadenosine nucleosidase|nr:hypothetical protein [Acidimicrobiales bacterium]MDP6298373.1 hypothetical protein [Acidimicrobiales bacterium]HJM28245.1 hypothetical protein [Acidimicrobiales bacterium]
MHLNGPPLIVMAMEAEAAPVRSRLGMEGPGSEIVNGLSSRIWTNDNIYLVTNGNNQRFEVDSIGTLPAAFTTFSAIKAVQPGIVISAGTCGGFIQRGGFIGEPILANRCVFHDRRIPLAGFDAYSFGDFPVAKMDLIAQNLGFRLGTVSTGDALDAQSCDLERMDSVEALAKDMEAAAVGWVCEKLDTPFTALKVTTDLVDGDKPTETEFEENLQYASERLSEAMFALIHELKKSNN